MTSIPTSRATAGILRAVLPLVLAAGLVQELPAADRGVRNSKHNLSASGPGRVKSSQESYVCIFCHTTHAASKDAPLWNRYSSGTVYVPYTSTTAKSRPGQPTGASKLCLSCHDGTVALGMVRSRRQHIKFEGGIKKMPKGSANLGSDLSDDHPISFTYDKDLAAKNTELKDPSAINDAVRLDTNKQMQCTSCHDPHSDSFGHFLVMKNSQSALCTACHSKKGWQSSMHRLSTAEWDGTGTNPWPNTRRKSVKDNGCENCHTPHSAGIGQRLLIFPDEEDNCLSCHNGKVAAKNIKSVLNRASVHPILAESGVHDPTEHLINAPRHAECSDCHDPHAVNDTPATAPDAPGTIAGVRGVDSEGQAVTAITKEYQLCYRCHADSENKGPARVSRQYPETNVRLEFDTKSASYHPVEEKGRNTDVPSLIEPLKATSLIYCSDCHSTDRSDNPGTSLRGPHGSKWEPILVRRLETSDHSAESSSSYALCYGCHSRSSILGNESFPSHNVHIVDEKTACTTCHDPHGVPRNEHLINFNTEYVKPFNGTLQFRDLGRFSGSCSLRCHEVDHDETTY